MKVRSKPVEKEAFELQQSYANWPEWAIEALSANKIITHNMGKMTSGPVYYAEIKTLEGVMKADPGDFIIQGLNGELYPCKPEIFWKTYEEVREAKAVPVIEGAQLTGLGFR